MQSDRQMTARKTLSGLLQAAAVKCSQSALWFFLSPPNLIEFLTLASARQTPLETDAGTDAQCHLSSVLMFCWPGGKHR